MSESMTVKRPLFDRKSLTALILPLVVEQFLAMAIGAADTVMVSSCGEAAVSGISLVDSINVLLIQVFSALATGGAVVAGPVSGNGQKGRRERFGTSSDLCCAGGFAGHHLFLTADPRAAAAGDLWFD